MADREGVQRITPDEAVAALTAAARTERIPEERYEAAVLAVLALAAGTDPGPDPVIPASRIRETVKTALGEQEVLIHCMMGGFGADWSLAGAIGLARRDGAQCAWAPSIFRHDLAIQADGKMYRFDARRPRPDEEG